MCLVLDQESLRYPAVLLQEVVAAVGMRVSGEGGGVENDSTEFYMSEKQKSCEIECFYKNSYIQAWCWCDTSIDVGDMAGGRRERGRQNARSKASHRLVASDRGSDPGMLLGG